MHRYVQRTTIEECIAMISKVRYRLDIDRDDVLMCVALKLRKVERAMTAEIDDMAEDWMVD